MSLKACRGLEDLLPAETATWQSIETIARETALIHGYREIRTPLLEPADLFARVRGPENEVFRREQVTVRDRGGRAVALRPELTTGVLRAYVENKVYQGAQKFHKASYLGPVVYYQRGPHPHYVQDEHFGVEAIGSPSPAVDADVILFAGTFLKAVGLKKFTTHLSFRGCPLCVPQYHDMLREFLSEGEHHLCENCTRHMESDPFYILACPEAECRKVARILPTVYVRLCPECRRHFNNVQEDLRSGSVDFVVNPMLVPQAGYYNRTIFTIVADDGETILASGGRYDGLVESLGGPPTPACGFAARLAAVVKRVEAAGLPVEEVPPAEIVLAQSDDEADRTLTKTAAYLRQRGVRVERDYDNRTLKGQIRYATRVGARFLVVVGDDEVRHNAIPVRDVVRNTQELVPATRLGESLFQYLRSRARGRSSSAAAG